MVINSPNILPDQIALVKVIFTPGKEPEKPVLAQQQASKMSLDIEGFTNEGHVLFKYSNTDQGLDQTFGINLKKYLSHTELKAGPNRIFLEPWEMTAEERADAEKGDGPYIFKPEWRTPKAYTFSKLNQEVVYEKGQNIEQWTVLFDDAEKSEKAIVKVRFSPLTPEIIEFVVELNPVPVDDNQGKDIMVNWKMFNGFNANKTFWSDSNGLEMQERNIRKLPREDETIAGNMYPITSAIALRDFRNNSNTQVTLMNDRSQAGSADLSDTATIELMQHRRVLNDDDKGVSEPLNETDSSDDIGIKVHARYYMQIFDT